MRKATVTRNTAETRISLSLNLDGGGKSSVDTGVGFFNHMLTLFAKHGNFDLDTVCKGDVEVDGHHTVEDVGICLGDAFLDALGDMRGITRYGSVILPMDEALILCAVDISGRGGLSYGLQIPAQKVGSFDTELTEEFFLAFARRSGITVHVRQLSGTNSHHIIEGSFKAFSRALAAAVKLDAARAGEVPSTKGIID